jgi:hypothetical protein
VVIGGVVLGRPSDAVSAIVVCRALSSCPLALACRSEIIMEPFPSTTFVTAAQREHRPAGPPTCLATSQLSTSVIFLTSSIRL